jgi:hypothetical protein
MREWGYWDWTAYIALAIIVVWSTVKQLIESNSPELLGRMRSMFGRFPYRLRLFISMLPIILLIYATFVLAYRAIMFEETDTSTASAVKYEGSPIGIAWNSAKLNGHIPTKDQFYIQAITISGKNVSKSPVTISDAYVMSARDPTKVHMRIITPNHGGFLPSEINPIPSQARIDLVAPLGESLTPAGIKESEFIRKWDPFFVVIEYEGQSIKHEFGGVWILGQIKKFSGEDESEPHVTPKAK